MPFGPEKLAEPYTLSLTWDRARAVNPSSDYADVTVTDARHRIYTGTVVTPAFIAQRMEHDATSGECAGGTYFCVPRMVVVRSLDKGSLHRMVDDLVKNGDFPDYFQLQ